MDQGRTKEGKGRNSWKSLVWEVLERIYSHLRYPAQFSHTHNIQQPSHPIPLPASISLPSPKKQHISIEKESKSNICSNRKPMEWEGWERIDLEKAILSNPHTPMNFRCSLSLSFFLHLSQVSSSPFLYYQRSFIKGNWKRKAVLDLLDILLFRQERERG